MDGMPWHPAVVHLPIGLGLVAPLVALAVAVAVRRGAPRRPLWAVVVALQALALAGGIVALETGENEEERVERVVDEALIEEHAEAGEWFVWLAGAALVAGVGALAAPEGALAGAAAVGAIVLSGAGAGVVARAGHLGGHLVYAHGAAGAYAGDAARPADRAGHDHDD